MADVDLEDEELAPGASGEGGESGKGTSASKPWLDAIADAERIFNTYQEKADNIDKLYADLERLANKTRDREFQLFWANIQVMGPSIYSRPPIPVIVPRFKDRKPLVRVASELLERCAGIALEKVDPTIRMVRDDLTIVARGTVWIRYEAKSKDGGKDGGKGKYLTEKACVDHVDRKDFLHEPARNWGEVDWVSKRSWLTKPAMRKRFKKYSGDLYKDAAYTVRTDDKEADDGKQKAGVWEIWSKSKNRVFWVTDGCDKCLDEGAPHLTLDDFFPCPRPAYSTVQRRTLLPVPDMVFYKDQLEEINELTARLSALTDAVKVRGFYPAGAGEVGDAIEAAVKQTTDNQVLVPISNWAAFGNSAFKDIIVWLPIDMIVATIKELVAQRKELIADVHEISGLSDIMRGSTDPNETLGAQELKSQYGSIRVRDRQDEMVRFSRDITRIVSEIMAENFSPATLLEMSQLEIPTERDMQLQAKPLQQEIARIKTELAKAQRDPEIQAMIKQDPEKAQQVLQQADGQIQQLQAQIDELAKAPTVEKVIAFLRDQRTRPFMLDIETDSTIAPDENATKQRATEFVTAVGGYMAQALPFAETNPEAAPLISETLKFVASQFRAGRQLEGVIEEFADKMKQAATRAASQPKVNPEQIKAEAEAHAIQQKTQADAQDRQAKQGEAAAGQERENQRLQADLANKRADDERKASESQISIANMNAKRADEAQKHAQDMEKGALELELLRTKIDQVKVGTEATVKKTEASIEQGAAAAAAKAAAAEPKLEDA